MATQVKFYSTAAFTSNQNAGGVYFVGPSTKGELYKGTQRFGGGRVTEVANLAAAPDDAVQGDVIMCSVGGAFAYDGSKWVSIGPDIAALQSSWRSDITDWTGGLSVGDQSSIITSITQDADGKLTATAIKFPEITSPADGTVSLAGTSVKISGWDALVSKDEDLESRVSAIEGIVDAESSKVTAETAEFTNLTVSDTATFTATTVSATTLSVDTEDGATFGGSTISAIADREALAKIAAIAEASVTSDEDVAVGVTVVTQSGSVKDVEVTVDATSSASDIKPTADGTKLARAKDVADAISGLTGAMHFRGVFESKEAVTEPKNGDIILVGTKEYVYSIPEGQTTGSWVELGDESQVGNLVTYTGYDTALTTTAQTLAGGINELDAKIKGMDANVTSDGQNGVTVQVIQSAGAITSVVTSVAAIEDAARIVTGEYNVVTAGAVADKIAGIVEGLDATVTYTASGVGIEITEADGKLTAASVSITKDELNTALGTTNVADKTIATEIGETGSDTALATEKAVRDAIDDAALCWLDANGEIID